MGPRIPDANTHLPEIQELAGTLVRATGNGSVPATTTSLVYLRAGQIVGSTYQVMRHSVDLRKAGESEARIAGVATWWDAPYFSDAERAALALTEAATRIQDGAPGVTDEIWDAAAAHFDENQLSAIILNIAMTNFFNRINRTIREQAGKTW